MDAKSQSLGLPVDKISKVTGMASSFLTTRQTERSAWEAFLDQLAFACQIGPDLNLQKKLLGPILHQFHSGESPLPSPFPPSIWTVGAFLSSLARCVRDWLGGHDQKGAWAAGSWNPY